MELRNMSLALKNQMIYARNAAIMEDEIIVDLEDGRRISIPLAWFPRLQHGSKEERSNWRFIGKGEGIHWPDLDEDISMKGILMGKPSEESQPYLKRWLDSRLKNSMADDSSVS